MIHANAVSDTAAQPPGDKFDYFNLSNLKALETRFVNDLKEARADQNMSGEDLSTLSYQLSELTSCLPGERYDGGVTAQGLAWQAAIETNVESLPDNATKLDNLERAREHLDQLKEMNQSGQLGDFSKPLDNMLIEANLAILWAKDSYPVEGTGESPEDSKVQEEQPQQEAPPPP